MTNLSGNVALITGSTQGIGKAIAIRLAEAGVKVVINSRHSVDAGQALASSLPKALYLQGDASQESDCNMLITQTLEQYGRLDILINNASASWRIPHEDLDAATDEAFLSLWQSNLMSTWYLSRIALPHLKKSPTAHILNISSIAGLKPVGSSIPYAVSKAAVNHLTRLLAKVAAPKVRVNAIAPGYVTTPRTESWSDSKAFFESNTLLQRAGQPKDIAELALGLLSCDFITGQIVVADGGFV